MEDRYEIKSKIGQGGFGSVYRAVDKRMNREVAIKRINTSDEDGMLEEASRQLSKEAGALASLQHPNIITVYDVGSDEDGPYVVMELLTGSPLDELVDNAPLTWDDFRELAMQTQEALIGAQELDLVHRDIKPANVMLSWLPSGKFQVKLLDFGLAKLTQRPSLQTLNQADSIFGSIFFMSPEQFERAPIDRRTDMYAMGCVYYYALTGSHPFDGATAVEVMSAHLHHDFVPLDEVRPDIPKWVCDWVMWHMNRYPDDRPESARDALQVFVQNDKYPPVEAVAPAPAPVQAPARSGRPRLLIPGAEPLVPGEIPEKKPEPSGSVKVVTKTAPQALVPPTGKPSVHSSRQFDIEKAQSPASLTESVSVDESPPQEETPSTETSPEPEPAPIAEEPPVQTPPKKQFLATQKRPSVAPPFGGVSVKTTSQPEAQADEAPKASPMVIRRPTLSTSSQAVAAAATGPVVTPPAGPKLVSGPQPALVPATGPQPAFGPGTGAKPAAESQAVAQTELEAASENQPQASTAQVLTASARKAMPNSTKMAIAAVIALLVVLTGFFIVQRLGARKIMTEYNDVIRLAAHPETNSVPMNKAMLDTMLRNAMNVGSSTERETVFRALFLASSTDGTDIDSEIVRVVTEQPMMENVRLVLISQVLRRRANPKIVEPLLAFVSKTDNHDAAVAALQAVRNLVDDSHFDGLLNTLQFTSHVEVRRAAEEALVEIIGKSPRREQYAGKLHGVFNSSVNDDARHAALRLAGHVADEASLGFIREIFAGRVVKDQIAAIAALSSWRNADGFPVLINFYNGTDDATLRGRALDAGLRYANALDEREAEDGLRRDVWTQLSLNARSPDEQEKVVRGLATNHRDEWVIPLIEKFTSKNNPDRVIDLADRAISSIKARRNQ